MRGAFAITGFQSFKYYFVSSLCLCNCISINTFITPFLFPLFFFLMTPRTDRSQFISAFSSIASLNVPLIASFFVVIHADFIPLTATGIPQRSCSLRTVNCSREQIYREHSYPEFLETVIHGLRFAIFSHCESLVGAFYELLHTMPDVYYFIT